MDCHSNDSFRDFGPVRIVFSESINGFIVDWIQQTF